MSVSFSRIFLLLVLATTLPASLLAQGGPPGAEINDLALDPNNPQMMFAATNGGVYVSNSAGEIWTAHDEGLPRLDIPGVAGGGNILYAAARTSGVYRSVDRGPWTAVTNQIEGLDILAVETDPTDPNIVYAGAVDGIYKSLNRGDAWTSVSQGIDAGSYFEIAASPDDPELLFASNLSGDSSTGRVYRTTNGGTTWQQVISGPAAFNGFGFSRANPGIVWIASSGGLFLSPDSGATLDGPILPGTQFQDVAVDPADSQVVHAATRASGVVQSFDGGANWVLAGSGPPRAIVQRLLVTPETLYAGFAGSGVSRSHDGGATWRSSAAGMRAADVPALTINPANTRDLLASTTGGGMFRSTTGGDVWNESRGGLFSFQISSMERDPRNPDTVYAGTTNPVNPGDGAFLKSVDGGVTWETRAAGLAVFSVATHPTDGSTVYLGTPTNGFTGEPGLIISVNGGDSLQTVTGGAGELFFLDVLKVRIDQADPENLYLIVRDPFSFPAVYQVARSSNSGGSWLGSDVSTVPFTDLAIDPTDPSRLYLGSVSGIFRSVNRGENFTAINNGLPDSGDVTVSSIVVDANGGGAVYAATAAGVFRSADNGANWVPANNGLESAEVRQLRADPASGGIVYAATFDAGVYKTTDSGASWKPTGGVPAAASAGIVNAFTFRNAAVSPGEIVSLFGQNFGPAVGVSAGLDPDTGRLPVSLAGVRVFFDDIPAPLFYVQASQHNVQAPYEIAGRERVEVRVEYEGAASSPVTLPVQATHPGLWGGAVNPDGSVNSEQRPAPPASVVLLFATGAGAVSPALATGQPAPSAPPFPAPEAAVRVLVNGSPVNPLFAGLAPGFAGLLQINLQLPAGLSGRLEIELFIGDEPSPLNAVVFVN